MLFIKVTIECHSNADRPKYSEDIKEILGGKAEEDETDWRSGRVQIDKIIDYYPSHDRTYTFIDTTKETLSVKETVEEIDDLIACAKVEYYHKKYGR